MKLNKVFLGVLVLLAAIGGYVLITRFGQKPQTPPPTQTKASISGVISFSALKPEPGDKGNLTIKYRKYQTEGEFLPTNVMVALKNDVPWVWENALNGEIYELVAQLVIDGKTIRQSEPVVVTAPATDQDLALRVVWKDLPADVLKTQTASIKGKIQANGYLPKGATLVLESKERGLTKFDIVQNFDAPQPMQEFNWAKAKPLADYLLRASVMLNGKEVGKSEEVLANGGDDEIKITVNSKIQTESEAKPQPVVNNNPSPAPSPVSNGYLSGKVFITGPKKPGTNLVILWRYPGEKDYKTMATYTNPSYSGTDWKWQGAEIGREYEITALLKVNGTYDNGNAKSQIITANAEGVDFRINTGVTIKTPESKPSNISCEKTDGDRYKVTLKWPRIGDADTYWLQVGNTVDATSIKNEKRPPNDNGSDIVTVDQIRENRNYYARYAYATCAKCESNSLFSNFSSTLRFYCGNDPGENKSNTD